MEAMASVVRSRPSKRQTSASNTIVDLKELRARMDEVLNQLGAALVNDVSAQRTEPLQSRMALLGKLAAGLSVVDAETLPARGAGYGSRVSVRNLDTGAVDEYTLMPGSLIDVDANQVSLASPIGQALLGRTQGEQVIIDAPTRQVRLLITKVVTLMDLLENDGEAAR